MKHLSKDLEGYLRSKGVSDEQLLTIVEYSFEEFRDVMEKQLSQMYNVYQQALQNYTEAVLREQRGDKVVRYYSDPAGNLMYVYFQKRPAGFYTPDMEEGP